MADHGSDSDIDEDDFGHDVTPVASAPVVLIKIYNDVVDKIDHLYHSALANSFLSLNKSISNSLINHKILPSSLILNIN